MKSINFKINDFQYTTNNKLTIIQACLNNKIDIPRFCYHEKLSIAGNCRMCLVEDLKQVKPIASCAINITNSMIIYTNTVKVKKAREAVLSFLLANHPLDCPICDQGGECDLQDQSIIFGGDRGRFYEFKRSVEDKDCGPLIKTIMNRCIHCTRCVRFSTEIAGTHSLGVTGRGSKMEIGFYIENLLNNELSGNVIDLCPVGALTSKPFAFSARSWELKNYNSLDILDSMCSNIRIDVRGTKIMRIIPRINENINEDWITDKIRFSYDGLRRQRLYDPLLKINGVFLKLSWKKIFYFIKNLFLKYISVISYKKQKYFILNSFVGNLLDIETVYMLKLFNNKLSSNAFISSSCHKANDFRSYYSFNTAISNIKISDLCILVGVNLRVEMPLLNSKLRQAFLKNNLLIYLIGYYSNFNFFIKHLGLSIRVLINIIEGLHWICSKLVRNNAQTPLIITSHNCMAINSSLYLLFSFSFFKHTNIFVNNWVGLNILNNNIVDYSVSELNLMNSVHNQNLNYSFYYLSYLVGFDNLNFKNYTVTNNYIIYQGHHGDINVNFSNIVLPSAVFIEKNSLYCNLEGIVQKNKKILYNLGSGREDWKIINALSDVLSLNLNINNSYILLKNITNITPFFYKNSNISFFNHFFDNIKNFYIFNRPFISSINNFYNNDVISRASKIMSLCYNKFKVKNYNFIK